MTAPTFIACLTPTGQGAIATLALVGPESWQTVAQVFRSRSGKPLSAEPTAGRFALGKLGRDVADDVVLAVKRGGNSPWLELHAHGGLEVVRYLLDLFTSRGLTHCSWEELYRRVAGDPLQAAAAVALSRTVTVRTAAILLDQYHGAFAVAVGALRQHLERENFPSAQTLAEELAGRAKLGRHLTSPWKVVIAGAPNVGKSSLVNALAGFERCVVSPIPGTTRDVVTTIVGVNGWPVELTDTAGLRQRAGPLEEQGIRLAAEQMNEADLCLWVLDASAAPVWPSADVPTTVRIVLNKSDLPAAFDVASSDAPRISATTREGVPQLIEMISDWLVPDPPGAGAAVPFTPALCDFADEICRLLAGNCLEEARRLIVSVDAGLLP